MDKVGQAIAKAQAEQARKEQIDLLIVKVDELTVKVNQLLERAETLTAPSAKKKVTP